MFNLLLLVNCFVMWSDNVIISWLGVANGLLCLLFITIDERLNKERNGDNQMNSVDNTEG